MRILPCFTIFVTELIWFEYVSNSSLAYLIGALYCAC